MVKFAIGTIAGIILGVSIAVGAFSYVLSHTEQECHRFNVGMFNDAGMVYIGNIELCGENMEWSNIWGPISAPKPEDIAEGYNLQ